MTQRRQRPKNTKTTSVVTLAILPKGKSLLPMGKQLFVCDRLPQGEFALEKFSWIRQKSNKTDQPR